MRIDVEVKGLPEVIAAFAEVQGGVADLRKNATWLRVQQAYYKTVKQVFANEGGRSKWQGLSSPYKEIKAKQYGNVPILQRTKRLYRSMTQMGGEAIVDKQATEMTLGSRVPYGGYHQSGTSKMPSRPPIDFTDEQQKEILKPIGDSLRQLVANAKLRDLRGF